METSTYIYVLTIKLMTQKYGHKVGGDRTGMLIFEKVWKQGRVVVTVHNVAP